MAVYVDDMWQHPMGQFGRMKMSHMIADTTEELLAMADRIGVSRRWLQNAGTHKEHFDIAKSKRDLAVEHGAKEITMKDMGRMMRGRRMNTSCPVHSEQEFASARADGYVTRDA